MRLIGVISDAFDDVAQVGLWVKAIQLGSADQAVHDSGALTACIRPTE